MKFLSVIVLCATVGLLGVVRSQVSPAVQQVLPFLTDGFIGELGDLAEERIITLLEEEIEDHTANIARIREGCTTRGPSTIIPGTGDGAGDPELCRNCIEKKTMYHIKRCALMLDWGIPNCPRLKEAMSLDTAAGRTQAVTELLRWFRCLCDPTGHAANAFTEDCSTGTALTYGRTALTHCDLDEGRLQNLAESMVNDADSWFDVLTQVNRQCGVVIEEGGSVRASKPNCKPEMQGFSASRSSIPDRCRYFFHHPDCREACSGGAPPRVIPGPLIFDPNCPALPEAECALEKAEANLQAVFSGNLALSVEGADLVGIDGADVTIKFAVRGFTGQLTDFDMTLGVTLNDYIAAVPNIVDNAIATQNLRTDPATCLLPPAALTLDVEESDIALKIESEFLVKVNNPHPVLTQYINSGFVDLSLGVPVDLVLVIDSSGSIGADNYAIAISFLNDLMDYLDFDNGFGPFGLRLGVVTFSTRAKTGVEFNYLSDELAGRNQIDAIKAEMIGIKYKKGSTATDTGLDFGLQVMRDGRVYAKKVIMVITDGFSNNGERTCAKAAEVKAEGIEVYAFGITPNVRKEELECMSSDPTNIFEIKSFESAAKISQFLRIKSGGQ